jgi:hypothetical protein
MHHRGGHCPKSYACRRSAFIAAKAAPANEFGLLQRVFLRPQQKGLESLGSCFGADSMVRHYVEHLLYDIRNNGSNMCHSSERAARGTQGRHCNGDTLNLQARDPTCTCRLTDRPCQWQGQTIFPHVDAHVPATLTGQGTRAGCYVQTVFKILMLEMPPKNKQNKTCLSRVFFIVFQHFLHFFCILGRWPNLQFLHFFAFCIFQFGARRRRAPPVDTFCLGDSSFQACWDKKFEK